MKPGNIGLVRVGEVVGANGRAVIIVVAPLSPLFVFLHDAMAQAAEVALWRGADRRRSGAMQCAMSDPSTTAMTWSSI